jgi:hypothetical protein
MLLYIYGLSGLYKGILYLAELSAKRKDDS